MRNYFTIIIITLMLTYSCTAPTTKRPPLLGALLSPEIIYQQSIGKVVLITPLSQKSVGTGSIINDNGTILTNWHIVGESKLIWVTFNNKQALTKEDYNPIEWKIAEVIKVDPSLDLALIKIDSLVTKPFTFGDADELRVGQEVYSISHPQGHIFSFTKGVISKLPNKMEMIYQTFNNDEQSDIITRAAAFFGLQDVELSLINQKILANTIQLQFPQNAGSSGGPIIDVHGNLIGINSTAKRHGESLSFAIRIDEILDFLEDQHPDQSNILIEKYIEYPKNSKTKN